VGRDQLLPKVDEKEGGLALSQIYVLLTPWQKIMRAAKKGIGLRLTSDDVLRLSRDGAIEQRAELDDLEIKPPGEA
jgi:hypothetical protein